MKKVATIIYLCSVLFIQSYGQSSYQVKQLGDKGNFIYPPHSNLKLNCKKTALKSGCTFQYIYIDSIKMKNGTYYSVLDELISGKNVEYFTSSSPIEDICFDTECYGCYSKKSKQLILTSSKFKIKKRKPNSNTKSKYYTKSVSDLQDEDNGNCGITEGSGTNFKIKYSFDQKALLLQIDYGNIINNHTADEIKNSFFELSKNLLLEFSKHEKSQSVSYDWFTSSSQNLVEKIFELVPVPQEASLARFSWEIKDEFSFLLLNPKFSLKVDINTLSSSPPKPVDNWSYNFSNQVTINFYRDKEGHIKQLPFIIFSDKNTMPSNSYIGKTDSEQKDASTVLFTNSGDIQLSNNSKDQNYFGLFQNYMKRSSSFSTQAGNDDDSKIKDDDLFAGNSVLLFNNQVEPLFKGVADKSNIRGTFGSEGYLHFKYARLLITPVINIYLNNVPTVINLGSTISTVNQQFNFGSNFSIYRSFNGSYVKINNPFGTTILLPGDKIIF